MDEFKVYRCELCGNGLHIETEIADYQYCPECGHDTWAGVDFLTVPDVIPIFMRTGIVIVPPGGWEARLVKNHTQRSGASDEEIMGLLIDRFDWLKEQKEAHDERKVRAVLSVLRRRKENDKRGKDRHGIFGVQRGTAWQG